ncbi:MAG: DUF2130 domain-containing protein [Thaumarchaeota archaeon]|nr:DUF2130 domain-containing protein [Nitrososphaerota archaeon]
MESLDKLSSQKCPLCSKSLATDEYKQAISQLEEKLEKSFEQKNEFQKESYALDLEKIKERYDEELLQSHQSHKDQLTKVRTEVEESYELQSKELKKNYDMLTKQSQKISEQNQKQFEDLQKQLQLSHQKEMDEKSKEISRLEKQQKEYKKAATEKAAASFEAKERELEQKLSEKDIQLSRFSNEVESLKKQLTQSQSELKGEVGELDLLARLNEAFPNDHFRRQKRGTSSGDVMHQIRENGKSLDIPIVYDNKAAKTVTKNDIEKAKKYQKIHGTNYVIIVSANLPKTSVPNGLYGTRDGILLVHPSIVTEVTKQIRTAIIEISRLRLSSKDQESKQTQLYEYLTSSEFSRIMEDISAAYEALYKLQTKEEKDHQTLWKSRLHEIDRLVKLSNDYSSGIESITQTSLDEIQVEAKK